MHIEHRRFNRVDLLEISGRIDAATSPRLKQQFEALTDLEGGDIRITRLPERIREVFDLTGFTALFTHYDDVVTAVGSF
jgi:anti-sigma B factor antagonist